MFNIVLHEPRMPGNVGTIGRTAVALKCKLHLIKPYGFGDITEKEVRRAGLDYWKDLELFEYENIEDFWAKKIHFLLDIFLLQQKQLNLILRQNLKQGIIYILEEKMQDYLHIF